MKILPSDDLSHKPDYNKNWRKYTQENTVEPQSKPDCSTGFDNY